MIQHWLRKLRYHWQQMDGFLQIACVLALLNFLIAAFWIPACKSKLAALSQETAYLSGQRHATASQKIGVEAHRYLPNRLELVKIVRRVNAMADEHGLFIDRSAGQFQPAIDEGRIDPFMLELQVSGDYIGLRAFINETLKELPYVAISDLAFTRASPSDAELHMPLRLRVFLSP